MKYYVVTLVLAILFAGIANAEHLDLPETIIFENKKGDIIFPHIFHTKIAHCDTCHDYIKKGDPTYSRQVFGHSVCRGCHRAFIIDYPHAPVKCHDCHQGR